MAEITKEDVEAAEEALSKAKGDRHKSKKAHTAYRAQAHVTANVRQAWREQEVAAGRRANGFGVTVEDSEEGQ